MSGGKRIVPSSAKISNLILRKEESTKPLHPLSNRKQKARVDISTGAQDAANEYQSGFITDLQLTS